MLRPTSGRVVWKGTDIAGWAPHRVARAGIGFVPEDRRIFGELTVWENLDIAARAARRSGRWTLDTVYELFPKLGELRNRPGGYLSGGEQQMLTIDGIGHDSPRLYGGGAESPVQPRALHRVCRCAFAPFIIASRRWALADAGSPDGVAAVAYAYAMRQLKYVDTDKVLERALIR